MKTLLLTTIFGLAAAAAMAAPTQPVAAVHPVTDTYFGTTVSDDYRWMEANGPDLAAWMKAQNAFTRARLDAIPGRAALLQQIKAARDSETGTQDLLIAGGKFFYTQVQPGQNSAKLYVRDAAGGVPKLLLDPDTLGHGKPAAIDFFAPSMDGRYVAYGVSLGGSEASTLRVLAVASGKDQGVAIDRVDGDNDELLPVWWLPDGDFAYYRLHQLAKGENPADFFLKSRAFLHHLGSNPGGDGDTALFGYQVDPAVPVHPDQDAVVMTQPGSNYAFGVLTQNESADTINDIYVTDIHALEAGKPVWRQVVSSGDQVFGYAAAGDTIYLLTAHGAPRFKIVSTSLKAPDFSSAATVVAQSDAVITGLAAARDALYVNATVNGYSRIARLPFGNGAAGTGAAGIGAAQTLALPYPGTVAAGLAAGLYTDPTADGLVFPLESWTHPALWYRTDAAGAVADTGLQGLPKMDVSGLVSKEVTATSYDGTQVPLSIIMQDGTKLDGKNPTLLEGYGSYGLEITPSFWGGYVPFLRHGGIIAFAHPRGGGWYGEGWHQAGQKLKKLNTVFDFIACARYLEDQHYTAPAYLAGEGGSAGGITIGGAITWAPELFAAAIDSHGDTDALRMEFTPNGPPNIPEFGSVTTEDGFHGLYAMSAMQHVRDGTAYPAVLLQTGANDPRVEPYTVAKFAARLQAATSSHKPVLLSVDYQSGHGIGDTRAQDDAEEADALSFILWQAGDPAFQPK